MATYLTLTNSVLNELNDNQVWELPSLYKSTKQSTYGGTANYDLPSTDSPQSGDLN